MKEQHLHVESVESGVCTYQEPYNKPTIIIVGQANTCSVLWFCMGPRSYGLANTATLKLNISHIAPQSHNNTYVSTLPSVLPWEITILTIGKYRIDHVTEEDRCLHGNESRDPPPPTRPSL